MLGGGLQAEPAETSAELGSGDEPVAVGIAQLEQVARLDPPPLQQPAREGEHRAQVEDVELVGGGEEARDRVLLPVHLLAPSAMAYGAEEGQAMLHRVELHRADEHVGLLFGVL